MSNIYKLLFSLTFISSYAFFAQAQTLCNSDSTFRVLHFTKTTGFDHGTRVNSASMFSALGTSNGFTVTDTESSDIFDELDSLNKFAVIVFSNTSGNSLFNESQKSNFENYINGGGSYIGIHAASDTYRTGWFFYNQLVGGIVQSSPNHTANNYPGVMHHQFDHEILQGIPNPWSKPEEYYYWDVNGGMVDTNTITTLLKLQSTGSMNYDRERPITWFKTFPSGARSFYTALGHSNSNYSQVNEFRTLVENAVCWSAYNSDENAANINPVIEAENSDIFLSDSTSGIIMTAGNGSCYKITIDNSGILSSVSVTCPN